MMAQIIAPKQKGDPLWSRPRCPVQAGALNARSCKREPPRSAMYWQRGSESKIETFP